MSDLVRGIRYVILVIFVVAFLGGLIWWVGWGCNMITKPARLVDEVTEPENVLYNYHWFYDQYENIKATDRKIEIKEDDIKYFESSAGPRSNWDWQDKSEYNRLTTELNGLKSHREKLVADYNARSQQLDREIFKGDNLPYKVQ